jgi:hypothetical protein
MELDHARDKLVHDVVFALLNFVRGCFNFIVEMGFGTLVVLFWLFVLVAIWWTADESVILFTTAVGITVDDVLDVLRKLAGGLDAGLNSGGSLINGALSDLHIDSSDPVPKVHIHIDSAAHYLGAWYVALVAVPMVCKAMNTWQKTLSVFVKYWLSDSVCPVVRHTYPVPWLYATMYFFLSWAVFNPEPYEDVYPPQNCEHETDEVLCAWLGFWRVFLYLVIPAYIVYRIYEAFGPFIWDVLGFAWYFVRVIYLFVEWAFAEVEDDLLHTRLVHLQAMEGVHRDLEEGLSKLPAVVQGVVNAA